MKLHFSLVIREDSLSEQVGKEVETMLLAHNFIYNEKAPDFVFCIGGDGTFLKAVQRYKNKLRAKKFVGIHTGSLGFFADFNTDDIAHLITELQSGSYRQKQYALVEANVTQNARTRKFYSVNEVKVENVHHTLVLEVFLNDQLLENYRGNGVLVCSQLGSTGYNKSLGGALIRRNLELLQYTKIAPISNSVYRPLTNPLILNAKDVLTFKGHNAFTYFGYDSFTTKLKDEPFTITVKLSRKKVTIVHKESRRYANIIREAFLK